MSRLQKFYVRETRDQLGRYPNWPINQEIGLGQIGYYSGRAAEFRWHTSLANLGISVASVKSESLVDELYTTEDAVQLNFTGDGGLAAKADFSFSRKKSIATQGFQMEHARLDLRDLLLQFTNAIKTKNVNWDFDWLIITELWSGQAFTTLISGQRSGQLSISAKTPSPGGAFNIANPALGLGVSSSTGMAYHGVAERQGKSRICPYFHVHKIVEYPRKGFALKRYGDDGGWLWHLVSRTDN